MRAFRSAVIVAGTAALFGMSLSVAAAKEEPAKTGTAATAAKDEAAKPAKTVKPAPAKKVVKDEVFKISNSFTVLKEIAAIPKQKIPPDLVKGSSAIAIFPKAAKRDFMVSGGSAGGVLLVHTEGRWSSPVFITLSGGTLGWQIVSDPMDIVLVFKNKKSVDAILKGKFTMDAKTAIEQGRLGPSMKAATARELKAEIASYVLSRGVFPDDNDVNVAGAVVHVDAAANDKFYATPKVAAADIISGKVVKSTDDIKALQKLLTDYAASK